MLHIANPIYDSVFKYRMEDDDMRRIVTRLLSAASDTQVRHSMNIEEEISMALENRDTEIMGFRRASAAFQWCYRRDDCIGSQCRH